jgi:hypothetical protein
VLLGVVDRRWFATRERWRSADHGRCDELLEGLARLGVTEIDVTDAFVCAYGQGETGIRWLGRESLRDTDGRPLLEALDRLRPKVAARSASTS